MVGRVEAGDASEDETLLVGAPVGCLSPDANLIPCRRTFIQAAFGGWCGCCGLRACSCLAPGARSRPESSVAARPTVQPARAGPGRWLPGANPATVSVGIPAGEEEDRHHLKRPRDGPSPFDVIQRVQVGEPPAGVSVRAITISHRPGVSCRWVPRGWCSSSRREIRAAAGAGPRRLSCPCPGS